MSESIVYRITKEELTASTHDELVAEVERLRDLLIRCWQAAGLLGERMTGQPFQAWEEPSDLVGQIEELWSGAESWRTEGEPLAELRDPGSRGRERGSESTRAEPAGHPRHGRGSQTLDRLLVE